MMDGEYRDFMIFDIKATGEYSELKIKKEDLRDFLNPENVFAIINQEINRIYLWKGVRSPVRKRFLGSRIATKIQGDMMKAGYKRCKVVAIDQGEELDEFLNVFGLESIEIKDELEEKRYIRNIEREQTRIASIISTKADSSSNLAEIQNYFDEDEQIVWSKSSIISLDNNWLKSILKNKKYKRRLTKTSEAGSLEIKEYKNTYVITNKNIISHTIFNRYCDFSEIPPRVFKIKKEGDIIILDQRELNSFEIEEFEDGYDVWFNAEPIDKGDNVFSFEGLNLEEYWTLINVLDKNYLAEIPEKVKKIRYVRKKR